MPQAMQGERTAIQAIRDRHPSVGLSRLARRIVKKDFNVDSDDYRDCVKANVPTRTFYSVYSVLRRYVSGLKTAAGSHLVGGVAA